jgi:hypothetical protein
MIDIKWLKTLGGGDKILAKGPVGSIVKCRMLNAVFTTGNKKVYTELSVSVVLQF